MLRNKKKIKPEIKVTLYNVDDYDELCKRLMKLICWHKSFMNFMTLSIIKKTKLSPEITVLSVKLTNYEFFILDEKSFKTLDNKMSQVGYKVSLIGGHQECVYHLMDANYIEIRWL